MQAHTRFGLIKFAVRFLRSRASVFGALMLCALLVVACGGPDGRVAACPSGDSVSATPNVLVAEFSTCSTSATSAHIEFGLDTHYGFSTSAQDLTPGTPATFLVAGMRQNTTYHMRAVFIAPDGTRTNGPDHTFATGALPASRLPSVHVMIPKGMHPAPGVELLVLLPGRNDKLQVAAYDPEGNLIWYYDYDSTLGATQPIRLLPNGHFLALISPGAGGMLREIDLSGKTIHTFTVDALNDELAAAHFDLHVSAINHDFLPLPNGHVLLLGTDLKTFANLPGETKPVTVAGNDIVDLDQNYKPVWVWKAFDHLDVNRHPMNFPDWTHANSIAYSADDGNLLFSLRHQSWILKIDYENGEGNGDIIWRLGYQGDFKLTSDNPADWFAAQHYVTFFSHATTGKFQLGLFDNGNRRVLNDDGTTCGLKVGPPCYSRAAVFGVNEDAKTASVDWAAKLPFSNWGGVNQLLDNSDVFVCLSTPKDNLGGARVEELTRTSPAKLVWDMDVNGQNSYRAIHLNSLYPGVRW